MIQKIKRQFLILSTALMFLAPTVGGTLIAGATNPAPPNCDAISGQVANGVQNSLPNNGGNSSIDCSSANVSDSSVTALARRIIITFSIIVGASSVIMIIYGGFRYIISGGDSNRVGAAKTSLIYAVIGLVIVALAQLIIHFVLTQSNQISSGN